MLTTLALHLLLIFIEYKPPSIENLTYLINGKHVSLNRIKEYFFNISKYDEAININSEPDEKQVIEDLTMNEYYRLMRVIHGRINLDPLYNGLGQFF